ncbi:hypothetical protein CMO96_01260 [Candidatus Woesebacteria bacterium]|nr:hypothetical protein [Candidatus Woesebacteria bacterium]
MTEVHRGETQQLRDFCKEWGLSYGEPELSLAVTNAAKPNKKIVQNKRYAYRTPEWRFEPGPHRVSLTGIRGR